MLLLLAGVAILCGVLLLLYLFVNAEPARLARALKWAGLILAAAAIVALSFYSRVLIFLLPLAVLGWLWRRFRSGFFGFGAPSASQSSDAETAFIRMRLNHDTGAMTGVVLQGRFAGMRVEELTLPDLLALLRECRAADEDGARLIEAYLDRVHSKWRDELHGAHQQPPQAASSDVTIDEAYEILGLAPGADAAAIHAAHHRLMKQLHPDHGGSDYLASRVNRARDVLLRK